MSDIKEVQAQLDLQMQINKVLQDRQAVLKAQEKALSGQVQLAVDMCKALKCEGLDDIEARLKTTREAMAKAAEEAARLKGNLEDVKGAGAGAGDSLGKLKKNMTAAKAAAAGFGLGIMQFGGIFVQTFKNVLSLAGGLISTLGKVGFAILTLPLKLLGGLFSLAQATGGGGPSPIALALEEIRKEMGGLNNIAGKAAAGALPAFRAQMANVAETGISMRKMFGPGREGIAAGMKYHLELMKAFGINASSMAQYMTKETIPALAAYRKGLGLSAEQMTKFMKRAVTLGKNPIKAVKEFANYSIQMGAVVGMSGSEFGKLMAEAVDDVENFGTMSKRSIAEATAYTARLGIKLKELIGVIGKFDNFEDAAQSVSKLNQMFGMQLDTLEMMNEQDPSKRLKKMQDAFRATGRDISAMSRVEKNLLATTAGLSAEQAELAFSQTGLSASYDDITKAGAQAEKKQLTQAEAMAKLADSIERVFGSGGGTQFKGFFDAFTQGFSRGIMKSKEFMEVARNIRKSLRVVYWEGVAIGKMFMKLFPGIKEMMGGLRDIFSPTKFKALMRDLKSIFEVFFRDLRTDPKAGAEKFIESIKKRFKDFFGAGGSLGMTVVEGGKTFLKALWGIAQAVGPMLLVGLIDAINAIAKFLESPPELSDSVKLLGNQLWESLVRVFNVLEERLWPPIKRMFSALWEKLGPWVEKTVYAIFYASVLKAIVRGAAGALGGLALAALTKMFLGIATTAGAASGAGPMSATATPFMPSIGQFLAAVGATLLIFAGVVAIYKLANLDPVDALGIGLLMVSLASSAALMTLALKMVPPAGTLASMGVKILAIGALMLVAGVATAAVMWILSKTAVPSIAQVGAFTAVILTLALASAPLILAAAVIGMMKTAAAQAIEGMIIIGGFMLVAGAAGAIVAALLSTFSNPQGVAAMMEGIASIIWATLGMIPAAVALAAVVSSTLGLGLGPIVAGFLVIAGLADVLIITLLPAIAMLAKINIPNPDSFKAVTGALVDIMHAVNGFVNALSGLAFMMRPTFAQTFDGGAFQDNISSMNRLVDTILKSGVTDIIDKLVGFAQTARIKNGTSEAISAIASVLGAVGTLLKAFSPDGAVFSKLAEVAGGRWYDVLTGGGVIMRAVVLHSLMNTMKEMQKETFKQIAKILPTIAKSVGSLLRSVESIPPGIKDVGPFISGFSSVLTAVSAIMKSMTPSDKAFGVAVAGADAFDGEDAGELMQTAFDGMKGIADRIVPLLSQMQPVLTNMMSGMMGALQPIISAAAGVNPQIISGLGQILSGVMGAVSSIMSTFISMMDVANERAGAYEDAASQSNAFKSTLTHITTLFNNMGPSISSLILPMQTMVNAIIAVAKEIKDTRGLKTKIEVVTAALSAVGQMSQIFGPDGPFYGAPAPKSTVSVSLIDGMVTMMDEVARRILRGPALKNIIEGFDSIKVNNPRSLKTKAEALSSVFSAIQTLSSGMKSMNENGALGLGAMAVSFNERLGDVGVITTAISSMSTILSAAPRTVEGSADRVNAMVQAYNSLSQALSSPLDSENISAVVDLGRALEGQKSLTVKHENVNINVAIDVKMDATSVGKGILEVNNRGTNPFNISGNRRFATE